MFGFSNEYAPVQLHTIVVSLIFLFILIYFAFFIICVEKNLVFWGVPGCSGGVPGVFRGVPGVFRGVPGCSGLF